MVFVQSVISAVEILFYKRTNPHAEAAKGLYKAWQ